MDYAKQYLAYFDEVYKANSVTRFLETGKEKYKPLGANQVLVNTLTLSGNYDYSRSAGYTAGTVSNTWVAYSLAMDRGLELTLDVMDADEAQVQAANLQDSYLREKFFPELDLYRFTKIYADINGSSVSGTNIVEGTPTADTIVKLIDDGISLLNDAEVPMDARVIFISESSYQCLKESGEFFKIKMASEMSTILNREVETFDGHFIIRVPVARFNTAATFGSGSNSTTGTAINFMIVHVPAILAIIKRNILKITPPEINQISDGFLVQARNYHGCNVLGNKVSGVYIHKKAA